MQVIYVADHVSHYPENFLVHGRIRQNPEVPERAQRILDAVVAGGRMVIAPPDYGRGPAAAVHTAEYLEFLAHIHARWQALEGAAPEVIPHIHPSRFEGSRPMSAVGQAGYHMGDTSCPIGPATWDAAQRSADSATCAADQVVAGADVVYALCRPPGHHAYADMAGGFCFLNNSAIAAQRLRHNMDRVAIVDVDVHHGNGTQGIFYRRADVLTVSLHADPATFYPFFWGYAHERGAGSGHGYNYNLPLAHGTGDDGYLAALETAFGRIDAFQPDALVLALGLDAYHGDPLAALAVTTEGFRRMGVALGALGLPTVIVQEGGYLCDALGDNAAAFLDGFESTR